MNSVLSSVFSLIFLKYLYICGMNSDKKEAIDFFTERKTQLELELRSVNLVLASLHKEAKLDFSKFVAIGYANTRKIPQEYVPTLKYPAQVMWLLHTGGAQTVEDMIAWITVLYGVENEKRLFKGLTHAASLMYKKGEIDAVKIGKANKYSLKKTPELSD